MDPPQCVQNAMMTKDKKPFTYTPGGIDLSEVKSPRMQRRIERNANLGGASDMPQPPHPAPQNYGPLPPSALAAMRPQTQVQVFPGPPPPPPMSKNIPPPPPPPTCPLPTQKVTTSDNQVLERPDMTKIIPDNPMALLRKTGGPAPRKSLVDQMFEEQMAPPAPPQRNFEAQSPRYQPPERPAPTPTPASPPVQQQQRQPQVYQPPTPPQNQYQPTYQPSQPAQPPYQPPQPQYQPVQVQQQRSTDSPKPTQIGYHPPIIERQATLPRDEQPQKNVGSLYIPPRGQQQQKVASPPTPPEREVAVQSPGGATLKEAPRPWQQRGAQQQQELPPWAKKDEVEPSQSPPSVPNRQQRWPQISPIPQQQTSPQQPIRQQGSAQQFSPRPQQQQSPRSPPTQNQPFASNSFPVHIEIRTGPYQDEPEQGKSPNAVYITQPIVLQHPGPRIEPPYKGPAQPKPQQQQQQQQQYEPQQQYQQTRKVVQQQSQSRVESSGTRIIPIQVEGNNSPSPGDPRTLGRQSSWGTQPTQSNSFKVIQKFTKTDDEEDDTPITQHSARYPQEMSEQMRKMKINDNGHFRQEVYWHPDEENPRYRGGYVSSNIFKYLDQAGPQQNSGKNVQMQQGNGQPQPYVHPSEQVVPEPKKYMGSNIPSRSFKILQAMTAPSENSANANYNEEIPCNPVFNPYNYPYYPPPYWPDYYTNFYPQEQSESYKTQEKTKSGRSTPLPQAPVYSQSYWHDYYENYPQEQSESTSKMSDKSFKSSTKSGRSTPLPPPMPAPFWGYMPPPPNYGQPCSTFKPENIRPQTPKPNSMEDSYHFPPMYPYYDPYYYSYYYGYPPVLPHYPYYGTSAEADEYSGYSSMDEMSNYNPSRKSSLKRRNSLENNVQNLRQHFEVRSKSATPRITITPTYSQENISFNIPPDKEKELEGSDTEKEENINQGKLRSIKSVQNLNFYAANNQLQEDTDTLESEESSEEETDEEEEISIDHSKEEIIPHQLSVIFEESERTESRRSFRCNSVASESTTIAEHHSEEEAEEDFLASQNVSYKIKLFQETSEAITLKSGNGTIIETFEQDTESFARLSINNGSKTSWAFDSEISNANSEVSNTKVETAPIDVSNNQKVVEKNNKEADEDWWGIIEKDDSNLNNSNETIQTSPVNSENPCHNLNPKTNSVMVEVGDELVCVKLREKSGRNKQNNFNNNDATEKIEDSKKGSDLFLEPAPQRSSIYDILKNEEDEEEIVFGGTLMRVDSFASQLEAIKRNSGLFNFDDSISNKPKEIIKEESFDNDDDKDENIMNKSDSTINDSIKYSEQVAENVITENEETEEIDFWSQIKNDEDDFTPRRRTLYLDEEDENADWLQNITDQQTNNQPIEMSNDSTNSSNSSSSESQKEDFNQDQKSKQLFTQDELKQNDEDDSEESSETDSSEEEEEEEEEEQQETTKANSQESERKSRSLEPQTIKERIEALRNSIAQKQKKVVEKEEITTCVRNKISAMEVPNNESRSKTASTKSSIKSFEEYSEEEELDSGVISDISRHISDSEEFPELRKLTRYERAATHSRLFKLLQDECDIDEEEEEQEVFPKKEDKFSKLSVRQNRGQNKLSPSRSKLSLPLNKCSENNEVTPIINEKLVEELVQSLLKSKKAHMFRNMPKEKLYAAAVTILQEGIDSNETPSEEFSSLLSPLRGDTETSTPAQTPQEFYGDFTEYKQYYETWNDAAMEIMPSKAFKLLQEHIGANKIGSIEGILAKCPRILSSKNVPKEILKLIDENNGSDCSSNPSQNRSNSNDVTNT